MGHFLVVRRLKSVAWGSLGHPRPGNFLPMIGEAVNLAPIVFILVILLFGFNSTGQMKNRRQYNDLALKHRLRNFTWL
jgi:hypothetical protein